MCFGEQVRHKNTSQTLKTQGRRHSYQVHLILEDKTTQWDFLQQLATTTKNYTNSMWKKNYINNNGLMRWGEASPGVQNTGNGHQINT